ncbi:glycogen synthase GlgA [Mesobaculum littorinae]|uniref:Glycogen synthase n=1 Tax=Mesobaculum littorinae TaxID=2486419 RepID=A0A438ALR3_9RHOB|nr:glycogen synthase GlgA [Mesobaculum littorinae]RVV99612.1 glycogen synthase GlgA [Mesobaculum littorinae]
MIRVLSVASEIAPLVKTGGLADVTGALPHALEAVDVEMRTLVPGYPQILSACDPGPPLMEEADLFGGPARVRPAKAGDLRLLVLEAPHLYDRDGTIYLAPDRSDWADNADRFAALSWIAARIGAEGAEGWQPDILHCHDWQAGLAPLYLRAMGAGDRVASVLTVHNIAFNGCSPGERRGDLRIPDWAWHSEGAEFWGQVSSLKAGLVYADRVTTVSPTYALELMTSEFGMGMEGVLRARRKAFCGILNGIDTDLWDPARDRDIAGRFKTPQGKLRNRDALLAEFGLEPGDGPLAVVVSRLTQQKGLDLLLEALPHFLDRGGRLALLGTGDAALEEAWRQAAARYRGVGVCIGYDEAMSHRMIAGGDAILVPSRFEPCGLTQLYGLRYGAIPVVALTGGLADTVIDANDAAQKAGVATGIQFAPVNALALSGALDRLIDLHADAAQWRRVQRNAMRHPVGWESSARQYADLYESMTTRR